MREVLIAGAVRTPIGKFMGSLKPLRAPKLGSLAVADAMREAYPEIADSREHVAKIVLLGR